MPTPVRPLPAPPPGYQVLSELGRPDVLFCTRSGSRERVVVRIDSTAGGDERRAELGVLAAVRHPGLAGLVDHGSLPGGGSFVARSWVEGADLEAWLEAWLESLDAGERGVAVARVVARLCPALAHLHAAGFVHADLKPGNVIVRADGQPVLTDFGLARARGAAAHATGVSGTLFAIAPEVLLGGAPDARSDLFALGVLLHQLLVRRRPSAREFYARFPRLAFFEAAESTPDELPEWARDIVAALVSRDPERRPASAAALGRALAGRLGLPDVARALAAEQEALRFPLRLGHETWLDTLEPRIAQAQHTLVWVRVPEHEDAGALAREIALARAIAGGRVRSIDLAAAVDGLNDAAQLEAWAERTAAAAVDAWLVCTQAGANAWRERAVVTLARALALQRSGTARLVVTSLHAAPRAIASLALDFPPVPATEVERWLRERMPAEDEQRVRAFAELLARASHGAARELQALLGVAGADGWILPGESGTAGDRALRLRPGPLPSRLTSDASARDTRGLAPGARALLAALHVCGGSAELGEAAELAGLADETSVVAELSRVRLTALRVGSRAPVLEALAAVPRAVVDESRWRALAAQRARMLVARNAPAHAVLPLAHRAGHASDADVASAAAELRDRGLAELALELCDALQREAQHAGTRLAPGITGEHALAWCALGEPERAEALLEGLAEAADPATQSLCERVRGRVAAARHEHARALACFERALELDPADGGEALLGRVQLCYELRRDHELVALVDAATEPGAAALQPRIAALVRTFAAMSRLRIGEIEHARAVLASELADATLAHDPGRIAGLRVNLGTLERRAGDLAAALTHFEQAVAHLERAGIPTRLAEARALYGAALRDAGELRRAAPLFTAALAARVRLGDERGADAVRGMLGLLLAERGHARAALQELELAASSLNAAGRAADAGLLAVKADEVRARLGARAPVARRGESDRALEGDPRVLLALARAQALRGDAQAALELVERAAVQGRALGLIAVQGEARLLARWLAPDRAAAAATDAHSEPEGAARDLWQRDEELCALLARGPWSSDDLAYAERLAAELEHIGRDDRAARAWLALAARAPTRELRQTSSARAEKCLAACTAGLAADEAAALKKNLLGLPDPWPEDLLARDPTEEEQEMEIASLLEINHRMLAQEDLAGLLGTIVEQALAVSGAQRGFLVLEEQGELRIDTAMDSRRGGLEDNEVELSGSVLKEALAGMQPLRISNAVDDPLLARAPSVIALELRSILCVPFLVEPGLRGVIYVDHRLREAAFDERAERMLRLLADQAGLAILQVRRLDEIRRLNRELNREKASVESDLRTARKALHTAGLPGPAGGLVGNSASMRAVHHLLERAAPSMLPVLVGGASGTGKELAARALHDLSPRHGGPFVGENCAALPASLIEAELFGAKRGAFTGAERDREGLFERAHGGTLFLDEIGELPLELQAKLLRVLETSTVRRLGDSRERKVDFRLVAATNRDLEREVAEGRFRADLYYRLNGLRVDMPPLAARREDVPALVDHFLRMEAAPGRAPRAISEAVLARLCRREWPGNVRELFNELARLCVMSPGALDDPELVRPAGAETVTAPPSGAVRTLAELERDAIEHALRETGGDKRRAAELLGISRAKVYQRLKEWGVASD